MRESIRGKFAKGRSFLLTSVVSLHRKISIIPTQQFGLQKEEGIFDCTSTKLKERRGIKGEKQSEENTQVGKNENE